MKRKSTYVRGKVFESLETAREYIRTRREAKGYDF